MKNTKRFNIVVGVIGGLSVSFSALSANGFKIWDKSSPDFKTFEKYYYLSGFPAEKRARDEDRDSPLPNIVEYITQKVDEINCEELVETPEDIALSTLEDSDSFKLFETVDRPKIEAVAREAMNNCEFANRVIKSFPERVRKKGIGNEKKYLFYKLNKDSYDVKDLGRSPDAIIESVFGNGISESDKEIYKFIIDKWNLTSKENYLYDEFIVKDKIMGKFQDSIPGYGQGCFDSVLKQFTTGGNPIREQISKAKSFYNEHYRVGISEDPSPLLPGSLIGNVSGLVDKKYEPPIIAEDGTKISSYREAAQYAAKHSKDLCTDLDTAEGQDGNVFKKSKKTLSQMTPAEYAKYKALDNNIYENAYNECLKTDPVSGESEDDSEERKQFCARQAKQAEIDYMKKVKQKRALVNELTSMAGSCSKEELLSYLSAHQQNLSDQEKALITSGDLQKSIQEIEAAKAEAKGEENCSAFMFNSPKGASVPIDLPSLSMPSLLDAYKKILEEARKQLKKKLNISKCKLAEEAYKAMNNVVKGVSKAASKAAEKASSYAKDQFGKASQLVQDTQSNIKRLAQEKVNQTVQEASKQVLGDALKNDGLVGDMARGVQKGVESSAPTTGYSSKDLVNDTVNSATNLREDAKGDIYREVVNTSEETGESIGKNIGKKATKKFN